ncbi:prepilin peptidase [Patescibacteria group bacterium]|nr:prepilin peptidase [Patescibacteria group bacterium]
MILLFIFIFGLIIGSFLNVVIFRLETEEKIVNDRSKCLSCNHVLNWYDLVPVFSFLFLHGKCRYCSKKISLQYPIVEILTGLSFVSVGIFFPFSLSVALLLKWIFLFYIFSTLIVVFFYDLRHFIIPDKVIFPAMVVGLIYNFVVDFILNRYTRLDYIFTGNGLEAQFYLLIFGSHFFNTVFAAFLGFLSLLSILLITKGRGMGGGDVKLAFLMGLVLTWPAIIVAIFSSFILGSIYGVTLILLGKKKMSSMVPFGPFLVVGTVLGLFWGNEIMSWYFQSFR